jgi:hypothetical protein
LIALALVLVLSAVAFAAEPLFKGSEAIPSDAIVLFNGKDLSAFNSCGSSEPPQWIVKDGYCSPKGPDICSKQLFKDCQLHIEFWVPYKPGFTGQARGNSGVFFMGFTYEIQVLDSYKLQPINNDCGSIYSYYPPLVNACRPPEVWQTYDIIFHAAKFDANGKKIANASATVLQNGVLVQDNKEFPGPTPNHDGVDPEDAGPIELQNHGNPVRFRNIWVRPL